MHEVEGVGDRLAPSLSSDHSTDAGCRTVAYPPDQRAYPSQIKGIAKSIAPATGTTAAAPSMANSIAAVRGRIPARTVAMPKSTEPMARLRWPSR